MLHKPDGIVLLRVISPPRARLQYSPAVMGAGHIKGSMTTLLEVRVWNLYQLLSLNKYHTNYFQKAVKLWLILHE